MKRFKEIQQHWYEGLKDRGWNSQFLNNHDHTRQVTRYGNDREFRIESAKLLATMIHTLPGMPYVYQGEEIGMTGVRFSSIEDYNDIMMKNKYREEVGKGRDPEEVFESLLALSRDNSRTPMHWNDSPNAGFTTGEPWIKINPNYQQINVEAALSDPNSVYYYYKKLIALRKENPVMVYGDYQDLSADNEHLYVYTRSLDGVRWLVMLNHSDSESVLTLPAEYDAEKRLIIANYGDVTDDQPIARVTLRPHEARVYQL
jgi:oligo-1,6-glucosidase